MVLGMFNCTTFVVAGLIAEVLLVLFFIGNTVQQARWNKAENEAKWQ